MSVRASASRASSVLPSKPRRNRHQPPGAGVIRIELGRRFAHRHGLLITTEREQRHVAHDRRIAREKRIARAQPQRAFEALETPFGLTAAGQCIAEPRIAERKAWIQLHGLRQMGHSRLGAPAPRVTEPEHKVAPRLLIIERHRALAGRKRAVGVLTDRRAGIEVEHADIGPPQQGVRVRVVGVDVDRLRQQRLRLLVLVRAQPPDVRQRADDKVPGVDVLGRLAANPRRFRHQDLREDRPDHVVGDVVLQFENVGQLAIIAFRPQMGAARGVDQLTGHPNGVGGLAHAAFENVADPELSGHIAHVDRLALVGKGGVARDHEEPWLMRQAGDDVFGEPVGEILLIGVAAHVLERQHRDRGLVGQGERRRRFGQPVDAHPKDANRPRDILELLLAQILEGDVEPALHVLLHAARHADPARLGQCLQPGRHVNSVAPHVAAVDDDVAEVDADPKLDALLRRRVGVALDHAALDFDGAADRVHDAREFHQHPVAGGAHDPTGILRDLGLDELAPMGFPLRERAFLVLADEPAVAGHVGRENGRKPSLRSLGCHATSPATRRRQSRHTEDQGPRAVESRRIKCRLLFAIPSGRISQERDGTGSVSWRRECLNPW